MASNSGIILSDHFDCVVMLTFSDWHKELRSNRYHYATRFSKHIPVIFVQPDLRDSKYEFENTDFRNITILHIYGQYGHQQSTLLNQALLVRDIIKPLLWIYNFHFVDFILKRYAVLKVYHATEDYFNPEFLAVDRLENLRKVVQHIDLLVAVSDGVRESYISRGRYFGRHVVLPNGCDFKFWMPNNEEISKVASQRGDDRKICFYQGNINDRLDFDLIEKTITGMPDWEFWFCGKVDPRCYKWEELKERKNNIKWIGLLKPDELRNAMFKATASIIPFVMNDWIVNRSLPLKAFEYVACGLPVVTVPIKSLEPYREVFEFASCAEEFIDSLRRSEQGRYDISEIRKRIEVAASQDYDLRFEDLQLEIKLGLSIGPSEKARLNIIILYDDKSTHIMTLREHLESFSLYSQHIVLYAVATNDAKCNLDLSIADVVIIHYSVRLSLNSHLSPQYSEALKGYGGIKILFIQDEYDTTETARNWISELGINVVFTCVPNNYIKAVYPRSRFRHVEFIHTLTGYVPIHLESFVNTSPIGERPIKIGYRGRELPYWYGNLGREKVVIGQRMKEICTKSGIVHDIEWADKKRIYGEGWYEFLRKCRAMLGTESGSNVFDEYGDLRGRILDSLEKNPSINYEDIHSEYLHKYEGKIQMNQISPKIFEGIAAKTALILYEGDYSGIVKPNIHYIPLKKNFSNIDQVLKKVSDNGYLEKLTNRAYADIIESGQFSYKKFVQDIDDLLTERVRKGNGIPLLLGLVGTKDEQKWDIIGGMIDAERVGFLRSVLTNRPVDQHEKFIEAKRRSSGLAKNRIARKLAAWPLLYNMCRKTYNILQSLSIMLIRKEK